MYIEREIFCKIFKDIDEIIYNCFDDVYNIENDNIKIWIYEVDEHYILDKETGIIVSWYKHLGRSNNCNKNLSLEAFEKWALKIYLYLVEEFLTKEGENMFEVTYVIDGLQKKMRVNADDSVTAQSIFTNMFSGQKVEIINVVRV